MQVWEPEDLQGWKGTRSRNIVYEKVEASRESASSATMSGIVVVDKFVGYETLKATLKQSFLTVTFCGAGKMNYTLRSTKVNGSEKRRLCTLRVEMAIAFSRHMANG